MVSNAPLPGGPKEGRLLTLSRHLAPVRGLRVETSLELVDGTLRSRRKPLFWVGVSHRDSQDVFTRLHEALQALQCPPEVLELHRAHSAHSLYQGIGLDMLPDQSGGRLFMHCRTQERIGIRWGDGTWQEARYITGRFTDRHMWDNLAEQIHAGQREAFLSLTQQKRVKTEAGYWLQLRQGLACEIYVTLPWHPAFDELHCHCPDLARQISSESLRHYGAGRVRHIGFSTQSEIDPKASFYISSGNVRSWSDDLKELEDSILRSSGRFSSEAMNRNVPAGY